MGFTNYEKKHVVKDVSLNWDEKNRTLNVAGNGRCELGTVEGSVVVRGNAEVIAEAVRGIAVAIGSDADVEVGVMTGDTSPGILDCFRGVEEKLTVAEQIKDELIKQDAESLLEPKLFQILLDIEEWASENGHTLPFSIIHSDSILDMEKVAGIVGVDWEVAESATKDKEYYEPIEKEFFKFLGFDEYFEPENFYCEGCNYIIKRNDDEIREKLIEIRDEMLSPGAYRDYCMDKEEYEQDREAEQISAMEDEAMWKELNEEDKQPIEELRNIDTWEEYLTKYGWKGHKTAERIAAVLADPKRCHPSWFSDAVEAWETNKSTGGQLAKLAENDQINYEIIRRMVVAFRRHRDTEYDNMLDEGIGKEDARGIIRDEGGVKF